MYIGPWQEYKLAKIIANLPEGVKEAVIHQRSQSDRRDIPVSLPEIEIPRSSQGNSRSSLRRPTGTTSRSLGGLHNWENNEAFGFVPTDTKRTKKPPKYLPPTQKRISGKKDPIQDIHKHRIAKMKELYGMAGEALDSSAASSSVSSRPDPLSLPSDSTPVKRASSRVERITPERKERELYFPSVVNAPLPASSSELPPVSRMGLQGHYHKTKNLLSSSPRNPFKVNHDKVAHLKDSTRQQLSAVNANDQAYSSFLSHGRSQPPRPFLERSANSSQNDPRCGETLNANLPRHLPTLESPAHARFRCSEANFTKPGSLSVETEENWEEQVDDLVDWSNKVGASKLESSDDWGISVDP